MTLEAIPQPARSAGPALDAEALLSNPELVWMGQNTTHLDPPPEVVAALLDSTRRNEFQFYAPMLGFRELRELIIDDLGVPDASVMVTDGAVGGLHHICTALVRSVSRLLVTDPGWPWPARFVHFAGVPVTTIPVYSPEHGYKLTAQQLKSAILPHSLLYLVDPLNPLGSMYDRDELQEIVDVLRANDSLIIHDCTYRHFATGHTLVAELYPEGTLTTYSFSKWLGIAGLRLGAIVAAPELLAPLSEVPSNPLGASIQAQRAGIAGLRVKDTWLPRLRAVNDANQRSIVDAVHASGLGDLVVVPSQGNFLAIDVSRNRWGSAALCARLLEENIFIRSGSYQSPAFGERFVKVSTSVPPAWADRFVDAWRRVATETPQP